MVHEKKENFTAQMVVSEKHTIKRCAETIFACAVYVYIKRGLPGSVIKKAILCEIKSLEQPKSFDDQMQILSNKKNPIACELCGQFMNGERGIQIHMARKHK
ncbi:hypothetical protein BpHYR1_021470 [Brachionus plicatilis]|uniref:C2H2-type domain-containing protein n=1 Tax=Brachionus plicatilis TaxID=10195 RepID=A0A3M7Q287_BRAPC|nr:hypothetical protein BpHYR1_021470 [Brachionus plicatilis]